MHNHCQIWQKERIPKVRKAELFLYTTRRLILLYISTKYHQNIQKGITEQTQNQFKKQNKGR